jgi:hypothetical protein
MKSGLYRELAADAGSSDGSGGHAGGHSQGQWPVGLPWFIIPGQRGGQGPPGRVPLSPKVEVEW